MTTEQKKVLPITFIGRVRKRSISAFSGRALLLCILALPIFLPSYVKAQCNNPVNQNGTMAGGVVGNSIYSTTSFLYPFLNMNNCSANGSAPYWTGPTIPNWYNATGTPDANPTTGQQYVAAQIAENINYISNRTYESFYTTANLAPNTTYSIIFDLAVVNMKGAISTNVQIVNRTDNSNFNTACSADDLLPLAANGQILYNNNFVSTGAANNPPSFVKVCGSFTTGATVTSNMIWFRFSFSSPVSSAQAQNMNYIRNFNIYQCLSPVSIASACSGGNPILSSSVQPTLPNPTYQWTLNGNSISGATQSSYTAFSSGQYNLQVNSGAFCQFISPVNIIVPTVSVSESCTGGKKVLTASANPVLTGGTYQWFLNNNPIAGATQSTYSPFINGNYKVAITSNGCTYSSSIRAVSLLTVSILAPSGTSILCAGQNTITLNASTNGGFGTITYGWSGPGTNGSTATSIATSSAGTFGVTVTDQQGCTSTAGTSVINSLQITCPQPICPGDAPRLTIANSNGITGNYQAGWYLAGVANPELLTFIKEEGDYFGVAVTAACTLKTQTPCHISFLPHPDPLTLSQTGNGYGCQNDQTTISINNPGLNDLNHDGNYLNDGITYLWSNGSTNLSGFTATGFGSWSITAVNQTTGCKATSNGVGLSGPQLNITRNCVDNSHVLLTANANFTPGTYQWFSYNPSTHTRTQITNPSLLSNNGASLTVTTPGIYLVTNNGSICPGTEGRIYESMVTTLPTHSDLVGTVDGNFDNLSSCGSARQFTSDLGCIDRSYYTIGNPNYINPSNYGSVLPGNYMINQPGLSANDWNPGYWYGTGYRGDAFMIVDGTPSLSEKVIWRKTVPVVAGNNYFFKAQLRNISAGASLVTEEIPSVYLRITYAGTGGTTGSYSERRQILYKNVNPNWIDMVGLTPALGFVDNAYNLVQPTQATIEIVVEAGNVVGRDLGIDNISFTPYGICDNTDDPNDRGCGSTATVDFYQKSACIGVSMTFNVLDGTSNPNIQYNWTKKGDPNSVPVNTKTFTVTPDETTDYILTVYNTQLGCSFSQTVTAVVLGSGTALNAGKDMEICAGENVQLIATGGSSYTWSPATNLSSTSVANPSANPSVTTIYTVTSPGQGVNGCPNADRVKVTVNVAPVINTVTATRSNICIGESSNLSVTHSGGIAPYAYTWKVAGTTVATTQTITVTPTVNTVYGITVSDKKGCTSATIQQGIMVSSGNPLGTVFGSTTLCAGAAVRIQYYIATCAMINADNVFTLQLSNSTGSFANPVNIGSLASTGGGFINAVIPSGTAAGSGYRIRAVSSNNIYIGTDNGADITISTNCGSLLFDGTDDRITIPHNTAYPTTGNFTMEAWIKMPSNQTGVPIILSKRSSYTDGFLFILFNGGKQLLFQAGGANSLNSSAFTSIYDNTCHHVAVTRTSGTLTFYLDGTALSGNPVNNNTMYSSNPILVGIDQVDPNPFRGNISEIRIWNISKSTSEIAASRNKVLAGNTTGLIGYWRFDEASGETVKDESPTANNGYLGTNSTTVDVANPLRAATPCASGNRVGFEEQTTTAVDMDSSLFSSAEVSIYPNPFSEETTILVSGLDDELSSVKILDITGKIIVEMTVKNNEKVFIGNQLQQGLYFVEINRHSERKILKIIKAE